MPDQRMPWDMQQKVVVLKAQGGTPGNFNWTASTEVQLADHPVRVGGAVMHVESSEEHDDANLPYWEGRDINPVMSAMGGGGALMIGSHASSANDDGVYPVLSFGPWRFEGRDLAEGDKCTFIVYYRS